MEPGSFDPDLLETAVLPRRSFRAKPGQSCVVGWLSVIRCSLFGSFAPPPLLNGGKLPDGFFVTGTVHSLLRFDQRIEGKDPAATKGQLDCYASFPHNGELADTENKTQAVKLAEVGIQIEILQPAAELRRKLQ